MPKLPKIDPTSIDICAYLDWKGIHYRTGGKNISSGWIGLNCPWCDDPSEHLGIHLESKALSCWRCPEGSYGTAIRLIMKLERESYENAFPILKRFSTRILTDTSGKAAYTAVPAAENKVIEYFETAKVDLTAEHRKYLTSRNFDPDEIQQKYKIRSFGLVGRYKHRIAIPYYFRKQLVTFSTRLPGIGQGTYDHFPGELSVYDPKKILYNIDSCSDIILVVEGPLDVWRLGRGTAAVSGIKYTPEQVLLLSRFKRIFILFDTERKAQVAARRLAADLAATANSPYVEILTLPSGDPADLTTEDANYVKRQVFGSIF